MDQPSVRLLQTPKVFAAITAAIEDAGKHAAIDPDQIHLMGLSNGDKGVCLAESMPGQRFRSLIFLSAVFHDRFKPEELAARLKPRSALILSADARRCCASW